MFKLIVDYKLDFLYRINCVNYFPGLWERVVLHMAACPRPVYIMDTVIGLKENPFNGERAAIWWLPVTSIWGLWPFVVLVWAQGQVYRSKGRADRAGVLPGWSLLRYSWFIIPLLKESLWTRPPDDFAVFQSLHIIIVKLNTLSPWSRFIYQRYKVCFSCSSSLITTTVQPTPK